MKPRSESRALRALASLELTLWLLGLLMVLVVACTLAQVRLGLHGAVQSYIRSLFVWWQPQGSALRLPIFPGGALLGALLVVNLFAAQFSHLERSRRKAGLWVAHFGLLLLFAGEFATGLFSVETQLAFEEGESRDYLESPRRLELAVVDAGEAAFDRVVSVPERLFSRVGLIEHPRLPFSLLVKAYHPNAALERAAPGEAEGRAAPGAPASMATAGAGPGLVVFPRPRVTRDDERDQAALFVELLDGDRSLGTWLLSNGLGEQGLSLLGREFRLSLRPERTPLPYSLTLADFRHERYPGTDIPRNFSSRVRLKDPERGTERDALISMNDPLRYRGKAFYQASFGKEDRLSVLQVVDNPGWLIPYLACALVGLGLLLHFGLRFRPAAPAPGAAPPSASPGAAPPSASPGAASASPGACPVAAPEPFRGAEALR